jgi:hypothetical protein
MELFFATLMLFTVTFFASFIYYQKIRRAHEEYTESKFIVKGITNGFNKQVSRLSKAISGLEGEASETYDVALQALKVSRKAIEASISGEAERKVLTNMFENTKNTINDLRKEVQVISKRPVSILPASINAPIPLQQKDVLDQLTPTEIEVLILIDELAEGSVPEILKRIKKTREHTSRLLKKLFDKGFIDRNTNSMPYRYYLRKEIMELVKNYNSRNEMNL